MTTHSSEARKRREAREADEVSVRIEESETLFLQMVLANAALFGHAMNEQQDGGGIRQAFRQWSSDPN